MVLAVVRGLSERWLDDFVYEAVLDCLGGVEESAGSVVCFEMLERLAGGFGEVVEVSVPAAVEGLGLAL